MKKKALYILYLFSLLITMAACQDESIIDDNFDPSLRGQSDVSFNLEFKPLTPALETRTKGDAIKHINDLNIVIYKVENENTSLYNHFFIQRGEDDKLPTSTNDGLTNIVEDENNENYPDSEKGDGFAESTTCRASFKYSLPYGQYKIIAVANCGKLKDEEVTSENKIRNKELTWNTSNISQNAQMFGFFKDNSDYSSVISYDNRTSSESLTQVITINSRTTDLHAWLKRAASKVTVAFDGSSLKDNIYIYIHSVQIKDIPSKCFLGYSNKPNNENQLIEEGEMLKYGTGSDVTRGISITRGNSLGGSKHTETEDALFFYENVQGVHPNNLKGQQDENNNQVPDDNDNKIDKDGIDFGSYIEVKGYYKNNKKADLSQGPITYRFMLGKDITTDYNAERNYHYKLTMKFKNDANDPDWHIEYDEEPGIIVPDPYYISYSYNEKFMMPVKINGGQLVGNLIAEINSDDSKNVWNKHNWVPIDGTPSSYDFKKITFAKSGDYFNQNQVLNSGVWNGFLSLVQSNNTIIESPHGTSGDDAKTKTYNYNYVNWNANSANAKREYIPKAEYGTETIDDYIRSKSNTGAQSFEIPVYTRPKTLVTQTGYSGMNIYTSFNREAVVKLTAKIQDSNGIITDHVRYVTVIQTKRIVNPAGIWRNYDNFAPFNVIVMEEKNSTYFEPIKSEGGPWRAVIESGDWFTLNISEGDNATKVETNDDGTFLCVTGPTSSIIRFTYTPNANNAIDATQTRCGVIRVEYNNYQCVHRIFVRQGYAPLAIGSGTAKWHSFNMYKRDQETNSPLEEGTYFKIGNWNGIYASNNNEYGFNENSEEFECVNGKSKWNELEDNRYNGFSNPFTSNSNIRISNYDDWNALRKSCDFAFGVLYGDGATTTASSVEEAYGYMRIEGNGSSTKGMRGCFVYDKATGNNLFFPIGATGYGRRISSWLGKPTYKNDELVRRTGGILRYAHMDQLMDTGDWVQYRPMLYDLLFQQGAIYWFPKLENGHSAWDINYRTLDFNTFSSVATPSEYESDACFVRCVE